jgi:autotransporter translocation and assembly factor TamB
LIGVRATGTVHNDPAGVAIAGQVSQALRQSYFEIFGKRFYFDRIGLQFDGRTTLDPVLDVAARYDSPGAGRINVTVSGRLSNPEIVFSSEQDPAAGQTDVLAMLLLGRRSSNGAAEQGALAQQAQELAAAMLTGLVAGLTTNALRQQFAFLPMLIADPGTSGLQSGRYGAGVTQLNGRLYIEGTYGAVSSYNGAVNSVASQDTGRAQEFRFLSEFSITEHWSVSGQYGTSGRFGADLYWSP